MVQKLLSFFLTALSAVMALGFFLMTYAYFFGAKTPEDRASSCQKAIDAGGYLGINDPMGRCLADMEKGGDDALWVFSALLFVLMIVFYVLGKSLKPKQQ